MEASLPVCLLLAVTLVLGILSIGHVQGVITDKHGNSIADDGNISWVAIPVGNRSYVTEASYSEDGLGLLFAFARNFINTVQPNKFPFELLSELLNGSFDLGANYMQLIQYGMGFAVLFAIGMLFVIFLPICGCLVFCCRCCCGNCGGDMKAVYNKNEDCKRMGMAQALFLLVILMGASAGCVWMTNGRFTVALEYTDKTAGDNLDDFKTYFMNIADQFLYLATDMYSLVQEAILTDIGDVGQVMQSLIVDNLNIDDVITAVKELDTSIYNISDALAQVISDKDDLVTAANNLSTALNTLAADINNTKTTCSASGVACQLACDNMDTSQLTSASVDFSTLPDLTPVKSNVDALKGTNLTGQIEMVEAGLDGISALIDSAASSAQTSINITMNVLAANISAMCNEVIDKLNNSVDPSSFKADIKEFFAMIKSYDDYRVYFGYGLTGLFTGLVAITLLGLICGCLGHDREKLPTERGCLSNCGGCLLVIPVFIMFVVGSLLMLLTSLTFVIGGNMEKLCEPLADLTIFSEFLDQGGVPGFTIGSLLLGNTSVTVRIYDFLLGCRANKAPFMLLGLNTLLPLESILNTSQYTGSMTSDLSNLTSAVDLSSFVVLTPDMKSGIENISDSGLNSINFTSINNVVNQSVVSINLDDTITAMETIRDTCTGATRASWNNHIADTEEIRDKYIPNVENAQTQLLSSLASLESLISGLDAKVNNTISTAEDAEDQLQNNATAVVQQAIDDFVSRIINYIDQYADRAVYMVYNDIAPCRPIWNFYDSFTSILCNYTVDSLNAFWFGTGWGLLFFIPVMILSMKLSKYYRRMDKQEGYKEEEDVADEDYDDFEVRYDMMNRHNKVAPDPDYFD